MKKQIPTTLTITDDEATQRLDRVLQKHFPQATFALVQKLCRKGAIRLDGKRAKGNERVQAGQVVALTPALMQDAAPVQSVATAITLSKAERKQLQDAILYQDDWILVLNKPAGIPVQAGSSHKRSLDRLLPLLFPEKTPRLTHRLDMETSGCLVFAMNGRAARSLTKQFAGRYVQKIYWAVASGLLLDSEGEIKFSLSKSKGEGGEKVRASLDGKTAETYFKRLARKGELQWVELHPKTGRTHQIRAHMAALSAPLLGDGKYGGARKLGDEVVKNIYLHAREVTFRHPENDKPVTFKAPLPEHFQRLFDRYGWRAK